MRRWLRNHGPAFAFVYLLLAVYAVGMGLAVYRETRQPYVHRTTVVRNPCERSLKEFDRCVFDIFVGQGAPDYLQVTCDQVGRTACYLNARGGSAGDVCADAVVNVTKDGTPIPESPQPTKCR